MTSYPFNGQQETGHFCNYIIIIALHEREGENVSRPEAVEIIMVALSFPTELVDDSLVSRLILWEKTNGIFKETKNQLRE